jgi:hypothetical protein
MKTTILALALVVLSSGCATQAGYNWNRYDQQLYDYYKSPTKSEDFVASMEEHIKITEAAGSKPAPGIYAEVGTFYFKKGDAKTAVAYYTKELTAWPESKPFMSALIKTLEKPKSGGKQ